MSNEKPCEHQTPPPGCVWQCWYNPFWGCVAHVLRNGPGIDGVVGEFWSKVDGGFRWWVYRSHERGGGFGDNCETAEEATKLLCDAVSGEYLEVGGGG